MSAQDNLEYDLAMQLPARHRLHVRLSGISRTLTAHEICLLRELFDVAMMAADDEMRSDFYGLALTLGLVKDNMEYV